MPATRRFPAPLLVLALLCGCAPPVLEEWPGAAIVAGHPAWVRAAASVGSITVTIPGRRWYRQGSGFFVRPTLLVTDFHVIAEADRLLTIALPDGTVLPWSRIRLISRPYDLALIETPPTGILPLPLGSGARPGERVVALAGRWFAPPAGSRRGKRSSGDWERTGRRADPKRSTSCCCHRCRSVRDSAGDRW